MNKSSPKNFLRQNYHWIVVTSFIFLLAILHRFIIFTGDDYAYSQPATESLSEFLAFQYRHYLRANGRAIIHFFLTLAFADSDMSLWKIIAPVFTSAILILTAKAFTDSKREFQITLSVLCVVYLCFGGAFAGASIYSITPAFNYLYPLILMSTTAWLTKLTYKKSKSIWWLPFVSFFAGATMEQIGIMSIGYIVLIAFCNYLTNRTLPNKSVILAFFTSLAGYLTVMLAPGTFVRRGNSTRPFIENFIAAFTMLINIKSFIIFNSFMIISLCYWLFSVKTRYKSLRVFNILLSVSLLIGQLLNIFILINSLGITFDSNIIISLAWKLFDLMYIFAMVYVPALIFFVKKETKYAMHMIIALGSIFILFFASVSEYRPLVPGVIVMAVFIALTVTDMFICRKAKIIPLIVAGAICLISFGWNISSFRSNYLVHEENLRRIECYKSSSYTHGTLEILPCADPETAAYAINHTGRDYYSMYAHAFVDYYELPEDTIVAIKQPK